MAACSSMESPEQEEASGLPDMSGSIDFLASTFLADTHYKRIHCALATKWDKLQSLSAAMKLMEQHGVHLTEAEIEKLSRMDEMQQINALVMKMPQQSNEQFQRFFLQLQLLVSSATQIRRALEEGRPDLVNAALEDASNSGIAQYILRMAIVQAGSEIRTLRSSYEAWLKDSDGRMGKLIRGQEDCMQAQKKLAAAQAQFVQFTTGQNQKAKKVLMNFASTSSQGLISSAFNGWMTFTRQQKEEAVIRLEYEDRIQEANQRLVDYRSEKLAKTRAVLNRKAAASEAELLALCFRAVKEVTEDSKLDADSKMKLQALEQKLQNVKSSQTENTKRVMMRMSNDQDGAQVTMCWSAWVNFHLDYQKNKEMEDQVKKAEQQVQAFLKSQSGSAKKVLEGISGASEQGLLKTYLTAWIQVYEEKKQEDELSELLEGANSKMQNFASRSKNNARNVTERARLHMEQMVMLRFYSAWKLFAKLQITDGKFQRQIDFKRKQLVGVQKMFRDFAQQLESRLRSEKDTARELREGPGPSARKRLVKSEGTVSLPDINHKPTSVRTPHHRSPAMVDSGRYSSHRS